MRQNAEALLEEFGNYIGIPNLSFDEEDLCVLSFGDEVVCLSFRENTGQLMAYADIGVLENPPPKQALTGLLEANCLQPDGLTIGVRMDSERNAYVVAQSLLIDPNACEQERFQKILEFFITKQEEWRDALPRLASGGDAKTDKNAQLQQKSSSIRA